MDVILYVAAGVNVYIILVNFCNGGPAGVVGVNVYYIVLIVVLLLNQDNVILLFCCIFYFILIDSNNGPAGVVGVVDLLELLESLVMFLMYFSGVGIININSGKKSANK